MLGFNDICWFAEGLLKHDKTYGPLNDDNIIEAAKSLGWVDGAGAITSDGFSVLASLKARAAETDAHVS